MKTLNLIAAGLLAALAAHADTTATKVNLDQFADIVAKNPSLVVGADDIKTAKDPISFSVTVGKNTFTTESNPGSVFTAIRARVPAKTIHGENNVAYVQEYGRLYVIGEDPNAPEVYNVQKDIEDFYGDASDNTDAPSYVTNSYQPRSIVGSIVSYYYTSDTYGAGAAHPNYADGLSSVDVSKVQKNGDTLAYAQANLGDLVDEASLVNAIKADKWVRGKVSGADLKKVQTARNLQELGDALQEGLLNSGSCYSTPIYDGKLQSFAIYDYNAAKNLVAVRVSVGYSAHACAGEAPTVQLGLLVKPRADLEYSLKTQAKNKTGLLMKDVK